MFLLFFKESRLIRVSSESLPVNAEAMQKFANEMCSRMGADSWRISLDEKKVEEWVISPNGELIRIGQAPSTTHKFNFSSLAWEDARSLDDFKKKKWEEMKGCRLAALLAPLETPFGVFDADERGAINIKDTISLQAALVGMGMPSEVSFTLADNTEVTLTQQQMLTVGILLGARTQEVYSKGRALRVRIYATTSPGELNEILW